MLELYDCVLELLLRFFFEGVLAALPNRPGSFLGMLLVAFLLLLLVGGIAVAVFGVPVFCRPMQ